MNYCSSVMSLIQCLREPRDTGLKLQAARKLVINSISVMVEKAKRYMQVL